MALTDRETPETPAGTPLPQQGVLASRASPPNVGRRTLSALKGGMTDHRLRDGYSAAGDRAPIPGPARKDPETPGNARGVISVPEGRGSPETEDGINRGRQRGKVPGRPRPPATS